MFGEFEDILVGKEHDYHTELIARLKKMPGHVHETVLLRLKDVASEKLSDAAKNFNYPKEDVKKYVDKIWADWKAVVPDINDSSYIEKFDAFLGPTLSKLFIDPLPSTTERYDRVTKIAKIDKYVSKELVDYVRARPRAFGVEDPAHTA